MSTCRKFHVLTEIFDIVRVSNLLSGSITRLRCPPVLLYDTYQAYMSQMRK